MQSLFGGLDEILKCNSVALHCMSPWHLLSRAASDIFAHYFPCLSKSDDEPRTAI